MPERMEGVRGPSRGQWLMRGLLLFALAFANLNDVWSPDVLPNALFAWTLVREGDVDYDEFTGGGRIDREAYFFRACGASTATSPPSVPRSVGGPPAPGPNDHVCSVFPPGMAFLAFPLFLPFVIGGADPMDIGLLLRVGHVAAAAVETLATLLLWSVLRRFASERWTLVLVLLYFLGTSVRTVASQALWQHAGVHLAVAAALWLALVEAPLSRRRSILIGFALGLGAVVRQTTAILAAFVAGPRLRPLLAVISGAAFGALPLLVYNAVAFGDAFEQGYGSKPFDTPIWTGLLGLLVSPSRGLFVYEPYLLFASAAFVMLRRERRPVAERLVSLGVAWLAALVLYATYAEWWGGRVFGPRFLDDLAPVLFATLAWGIGRGLLERRAARVAFWICAAWSLLIFQAAAFVYDQSWDTYPTNVNFDPARLWDWADPQWLAVLGSVSGGGARVVVAAGLTALATLFLLRIERVIASRR